MKVIFQIMLLLLTILPLGAERIADFSLSETDLSPSNGWEFSNSGHYGFALLAERPELAEEYDTLRSFRRYPIMEKPGRFEEERSRNLALSGVLSSYSPYIFLRFKGEPGFRLKDLELISSFRIKLLNRGDPVTIILNFTDGRGNRMGIPIEGIGNSEGLWYEYSYVPPQYTVIKQAAPDLRIGELTLESLLIYSPDIYELIGRIHHQIYAFETESEHERVVKAFHDDPLALLPLMEKRVRLSIRYISVLGSEDELE